MVAKGKCGLKIDHPCRDTSIWNLSKHSIDRDIRFTNLTNNGTNRVIDHQRCWLWERERTRYFIDKEFRDRVDSTKKKVREYNQRVKNSKSVTQRDKVHLDWYVDKNKDELMEVLFPYYCEQWPQKAFLSITRDVRKKFLDAVESNGVDWFEHPLEDKLIPPNKTPLKDHSDRYAEIGYYEPGYIEEPPSESVPIKIHIRTDWTQERFIEVMKEYSKEILTAVREEKAKYEKMGYPFMKKESKKPVKTYKSLLKKLGHFRLSECVGLDYLEITKKYPEKKKDPKFYPYEDEAYKAAIREIRNFLKPSPKVDK